MRVFLAASASLILAMPVMAEEASDGWTCRNVAVEIACTAEECSVSDGHTPMSVTISPSEISACAYSGCWEGVPSASMQSGRFQVVTGSALPFSTDPDYLADISVTVDTNTGIATILISGQYAHPARCTPLKSGE